ncbi:MAG: nicotinamide-nucleotide adenylyltransferase [Thermoproteus sp.]|uniref:nicotinamide-nucleotide adenylyltransferase n=1 Tax=Thermoproteus sp. CP80 TaxID=1650659 RepID=UPI0007479AB5|nr:nicotinamide-nucleotide adenylyltransferase [Thermoproteus sp. CP80]KUO84297.1 MAG: cytidyltransferase [Thermoproteus sp. CIS_19]KUO88615.1 MAG: cytidyltransferase [Thermoproteus sp. JCHS_4]MDT7869413.1 nicotinamide-nucleotide adenylyltransferase [Thermoproteus sp.]MDT7881292.1 nicotinamide-nucleotide adenylyltransferase [Thermoproteus sp.]PLC66001.1 cytidyltransferase [Thermoproteus sp. CP80]
MRVAFIGRFQPLHLGHVKVLDWLLERYDEVLVVIGSADKGVTRDNPFTVGERMEMFLRTFDRRLILCPVPDTDGGSSLWGAYLRHWCPRFEIAFSNNGHVRAALRYAGIDVREHPLFDREALSGRRIRELIATGDQRWRGLVPQTVSDLIEEVDGVRRIRTLYEEG